MRKFSILLVILSLVFGATVFAQEDETPTIAEIVVASTEAEEPEFTTLLAAVSAAELVETLSDPEADFTVFAPTDEAFAAALEALDLEAEALLEDTETLTDILLYHVLDGGVMAEDVVTLDGEEVETLQGGMIAISVTDEGVFLNEEIEVITTDIEAANGVIHVIDGVLLPPADEEMDEEGEMAEEEGEMSEEEGMDEEGEMGEEEMMPTIAEIVVASTEAEEPEFTTLLAAVSAAELVETLSDPEADFTVFAPTDEAFAAALEALDLEAEALLEDTETLTDILLYHVLDGGVMAETVVTLDGEEVETLQGGMIAISVTDEGVFLNEEIEVITTDIEAANGVIHVIDGVLLPPADEEMSEEDGE